MHFHSSSEMEYENIFNFEYIEGKKAYLHLQLTKRMSKNGC